MYTALFSSQVATAHGYSLFRNELTRGSLSVIKNAIYDAWERLSSDATRSFAVKFPRYAETVVQAWGNRFWPAGVVQIPELFTEIARNLAFQKRFKRLGQFKNKVDFKNSECISKRFV